MTESERVQPESARRNVVLYSACAAAVIAALSAIPSWLTLTPHRGVDLFMQAVPPISAAALLAGLCIGFVSLMPFPRLTAATALTFSAMHIAITYAMAQLLSSRPSALIEPLPNQLPIQAWLTTPTWLIALTAEIVVFESSALAMWLRNQDPRTKEC